MKEDEENFNDDENNLDLTEQKKEVIAIESSQFSSSLVSSLRYDNHNNPNSFNAASAYEKNKDISLLKLESHTCPICMSNKKIGDIIVYSANIECNHTFHKECLVTWFMSISKEKVKNDNLSTTSFTCPNCRCLFV